MMSKGAGAFDRYNDPCDILSRELVSVGKGRVVHSVGTPGSLSEVIAGANIVRPVTVDKPMVETPLLLSEKGAAVTLLNWKGVPQKEVTITVRVPFKAKSVESIKQGKLTFTQTEEGIQCVLPLGAADIVLVRP